MDALDLKIGPVARGKDTLIVVVPAGTPGAMEKAARAGALPEPLARRAASRTRVKLGGNLALAPAEAGARTIAVLEVPGVEPAGPLAATSNGNGHSGLGLLSRVIEQIPLTERFRQAGAEVWGFLRAQALEEASVIVVSPDGAAPVGAFVEGLELASYAFDGYLAKKNTAKRRVTLASTVAAAELTAVVERARVVATSVHLARDLTNTPASDLGPEELERAAFQMAREVKIKARSFRQADLTKRGMGALLGVGKGSAREPRMIILEHKPAGAKRTIVLIGKGITFDSGGLSLKTAAGMELMKKDMAGAAAVLGAMRAAASLKLPLHLVALIPAAENMVDAHAQRPGDIVRSASGKTIEVINTDAEGRLVLADAMTYAQEFKPDVIVDLATLTGEAGRTFANVVSPVLGNDWSWIERVVEAGRAVHERVWPLPILDEYRKAMAGDVADLKNSSNLGGYSAGSILGASFLSEFAAGTPWVHLDIANTSWVGSDSGYLKKGATGMGVRLVFELLAQVAGRGDGPARARKGRASTDAA